MGGRKETRAKRMERGWEKGGWVGERGGERRNKIYGIKAKKVGERRQGSPHWLYL